MAMDILLQNDAKPDDIVLTDRTVKPRNSKRKHWECASKGHRKLLEFMLNCGTEVNAVLEVPENIQGKNTLLHIASLNCQTEVTRLLVERRTDIIIGNAQNDTALHSAALLDSVEIINF
jgi:ankyrin repeat protein